MKSILFLLAVAVVAISAKPTTPAQASDNLTSHNTSLPSYQELWTSVSYGNGKFVAVDYGSSATAYSTDGINWELATLPSYQRWYSVTYGNGKFVAVASHSNAAAYSTDGINWELVTIPSSDPIL